MALTNCKECGTQVSTAAQACPRCGAPVPSIARSTRKAASGIWTAIKVTIALVVGLVVFSCVSVMSKVGGDNNATTRSSATPTQVGDGSTAKDTAPPQISDWEYTKQDDPLTKKTTAFASVISADELSLGFPYNGSNHGRLSVRQSPRFGLDAYFEIQKGQLICGYGPGECKVKVSFDNAAPVTFSMTKPADSSSTTLFFSDAKRFIKLASAAKEMRVAAVVYQAGEPTLTFRPSAPLSWPPR